MSDYKDYWKELFGDDLPDELAQELGISGKDDGAGEKKTNEDAAQPPSSAPAEDAAFHIDDSGAQWMDLDNSFFGTNPGEPQADGMSDTNIIPDGESIAEITRGSIPTEIPGAELIVDEEEPLSPPASDPVDDEDWDEESDSPVHRERKKRTGCMGGLIYFAFIVALSLILCCFAWMAANDVLALNKEYVETEVTVPADYTISEVADTLKEQGLIKYTGLFELFAKVYHADQKITAGVYTLNTEYDYRALISNMSTGSGTLFVDDVVIPEGKTLAEICQILAEAEVCDYDSLMDAAANYDFNYAFLDDKELGDATRLEGYLFPDTYSFYRSSSAESALDKLLSNFKTKMLANGVDTLLESSSYSLDEIIVIASMIQMEAASDSEMPTVSSVIHNRLDAGMPLEIDATIQYVLKERVENLSDAQRDTDSPYNTYLNKGLPPAPITNPGIAAILAALQPEETGYYYYALHVDGYHKFYADSASHKAFVNSDEFAYYEG